MSEWRNRSEHEPPKDGTEFIAWDDRLGYALYTMHWDEDEFITDYEQWSGQFTYWRPALEPPFRQVALSTIGACLGMAWGYGLFLIGAAYF